MYQKPKNIVICVSPSTAGFIIFATTYKTRHGMGTTVVISAILQLRFNIFFVDFYLHVSSHQLLKKGRGVKYCLAFRLVRYCQIRKFFFLKISNFQSLYLSASLCQPLQASILGSVEIGENSKF